MQTLEAENRNRERHRLRQKLRLASMTEAQRDAHLAKKRAYAQKQWQENRERIKERNRASRAKALLIDPEAFRKRHSACCDKWIANNPEKRAESVLIYRNANRMECSRRAVLSHKKRIKADPIYRLEMRSRLAEYKKLKRAKSGKGFVDLNSRIAVEWFDWLKNRGIVDWQGSGIEIDHVLPMAFFDKTADGWAARVNHWTNLFPLEKRENIRKRDSIQMDYIFRVSELVQLFVTSR